MMVKNSRSTTLLCLSVGNVVLTLTVAFLLYCFAGELLPRALLRALMLRLLSSVCQTRAP